MGFATLITPFLLSLSFVLATFASDQLNLQKPLQQGAADDHPHFSLPSLPRKLNHVTSSAEEDATLRHEFRQASPGTKKHEKEENAMNAAEKVEEEEEKGPKKSQYFTMDYGWVRRRRPIHN